MNQIVTSEAFFLNIKQKLIAEIALAEKTIHVAVAWFTDKDLLAALVSRQKSGVRVALAVTRDRINESLSFETIEINGGICYKIDGALMHNKFCVLDGRDVITGSYNWTYRAASENHENIIITAGDYDLASRYIAEFNRITGDLNNADTSGGDISKIVRRMQVIRNLIQLDEQEDVLRQARRLGAEWQNALANQLYELLESGQFSSALSIIDDFISTQAQLLVYEDPMISGLKLEIRDLEYRIVAIESETADIEKVISVYNHDFSNRLGTITEEILRLKKEYALAHRQESQYSQSEYDEAKKRYEEFKQDRELEEKKAFYSLGDSDRDKLKKMHRQCVMLCHPDKVVDELKEHASEFFRQVQDCYERQDLMLMTALAAQLAQGILQPIKTEVLSLEYLKGKRQRLIAQLDAALQLLASLRSSVVFIQISLINDREQHFCDLEKELIDELTRWKLYVSQPETA